MTMIMMINALDHDGKMLMIMTMLMMIDSPDHDHVVDDLDRCSSP
jgi:hypothetical protein